jgi:DNA-binding response OmpR family regulator
MVRQPHSVLVVDDEPPIVELIAGYLRREGLSVASEGDGVAALARIRRDQPDVVILDVMLPGLDGVEVCRQLRTFSNAYVLMLTARGEEIDRIIGLTVGADDYLVKPFSPRELVARVKALLRRPRTSVLATASTVDEEAERDRLDGSSLPIGLAIDAPRRTVHVDGRPIDMTALEFNLLAVLGRHPGTVVSREQLLAAVWGSAYIADDHLVDVHVANLRRKLGDDAAMPRFIETVRGVGYRMMEGR